MLFYGYKKTNGTGSFLDVQVEDNMRVNGEYLNEEVDGYLQLTVAGRGLLETKIDTVDVLGRSGVHVKSSKHPTREFEIKYMMTASSSADLRDKYNVLNAKLSGKLEIAFDDEPSYVYRGVYMTGVDVVEETSLMLVSTFTLTATDPYKYGDMKTEGRVNLDKADFVDVYEVRVTFTKFATDPSVTVHSGDLVYFWSLGGDYQVGAVSVLTFDGTNSRSYTENNGDRVNTVSYDNLPRAVVAIDGTTGNVRDIDDVRCGELEFVYRDRAL